MPWFAECVPHKNIIQSGGAIYVALPLLLFVPMRRHIRIVVPMITITVK